MKQVDRERIHRALVGESALNFPGMLKELEELCAEDLRRIEPIVDEIVERERAEAWKQGAVSGALHASGRTH